MDDLWQRRLRGGRRLLLWAGVASTTGALLAATTTALLAPTTVAVAAPAPVADPYHAELQAAVNDLHELGAVGVQGQVSIGYYDTVAGAGEADRRSGAQMPLDGHFRIASNTKTFVSVVMLQLVGEGRLSLDDTVEHWLAGVVSGNGNDGNQITVRQLLQQTSGIYDYTYDLPVLASEAGYYEHRFERFELEDLAALAMQHPPRFAPDAGWEYSNTNYVLAGMVIEEVTGRPWWAEIRSRIVRPLGLRDTSYPDGRPTLPRPHARAYQQFDADGPLVDVTVFNPTGSGPVGGMVSTTADLARFWRALQGGELLKPRQLRELRQTILADSFQEFLPGLRYGLGSFWVPNECGGYWAHPGDVLGTTNMQAVTTSGDRAVTLYWTGKHADPGVGAAMQGRAFALFDEIICG